MHPCYCRVRVPVADAIGRFAAWLGLPEAGPLVPAASRDAVRLATDVRGTWRGNAVFVSDLGEWTLIQDVSGVLDGIPGEAWAEFAGGEDLLFASVNDAVGYGSLVVVCGGQVVREFVDDSNDPDANVDRGDTGSEYEPFESWVDVAGFLDEDELGFAETGWLWVW